MSFTGTAFDTRDFNAAYNGIKKNVKAAGRGDTTHFKPMPLEVQSAIHKLLGNLNALMRHRKNGDPVSYEEALRKLPHEYKHRYHELIVFGGQYTVAKFDVRRGQEGIEYLTKSHYVIEEDGDFKYWRKVNTGFLRLVRNKIKMFYSSFQAMGESSKNHQRDDEDLEKSGIIPFCNDEHGYNPGEFLENYLELTNPQQERLFQKPQRDCRKFDIHSFGTKQLFENKCLGKNMISSMLKKLLHAAGQPEKYTNHCLRPTGITGLKELGFEDRAIMNISGKK